MRFDAIGAAEPLTEPPDVPLALRHVITNADLQPHPAHAEVGWRIDAELGAVERATLKDAPPDRLPALADFSLDLAAEVLVLVIGHGSRLGPVRGIASEA